MGSFNGGFWNLFIVVVVLASFLGLYLLIRYFSGRPAGGAKVESTGHVWDGDLRELNNPLPRWWLNLFYITLVFGFIYLLLYPGLGSNDMLLGWTQEKQYRQEMKAAEQRYAPLYAKYAQESIPALAKNPEALKTGERLFASYCTVCHGSDARGVPGYPNLRDDDWLHGGDPQAIEASILNGRQGNMPAWKDTLGEAGVHQVAQYVLSLSGRKVDEAAAAKGKEIFKTQCVACHGPDGKGSQAIGAPNLTDHIWLYGGSPRVVEQTIANGRQGRMPAHKEFLGENKVHVLAAYVYSLSHGGQGTKMSMAPAGD